MDIIMNANLAKYRAYRRIIETFVFRGGIWPHNEDTISLYRLIGFIGFFLTSSIATKVLIYCISNIGNVSEFVAGLQNTLAASAPIIRIVNYTVYRSQLVSLDKELGGKFERELKIEKNRPALLKNISFYYKFMYFLIISTAIAIFLFCVPRFILIFKYKKYRQPFQGSYPFQVEPKSPLYWAIVVLETGMFWFTLHVVPGVDNAFGMHCFRICGLLRLAAERFQDLNPRDSNYKIQLYECVSIHQLVIRSKVALQKVYGGVILYNYIISAGLLCSILYQAHQMKSQMTVAKFIFFVTWMSMKLVQVFLYAYYGSCITLESQNYQDAIYKSSWPGCGNVRLMKELFLILTQRTVTLKACGYFHITMQFFEKICHTTISYFFLLQSLEAEH